MNVIVISAATCGAGLLAAGRYLWLWGTRDRRYDAAYARWTSQFAEASRKRALTTETGLMPVITEAPRRGDGSGDCPAAPGVQPTASATKPFGGDGGNVVVATDSGLTDAVTGGGVPAGEPIHRNAVVGALGRPRHSNTTPLTVLRAGGVHHAWQAASPPPPPAAATRTPRSA